MTAARQKRKHYCTWTLLLAAAFGLVETVPFAVGATSEMIVTDWHSGLAIDGYDPVAFFTDGKPLEGKADLELRYGGAVWRFRNIGNRQAFAERPDVYMPQFGGYDPTDVARGVAVPGNPNIWLIDGQRLLLFYDQARLKKFTANPDQAMAEAVRSWPDVVTTLSP